ncbi:isopentenyl-diphosphate delta-isomerase [Paenibacillus sp. J31TS4]|uniref:type 2 isopentenyl-diphosphate Delta-isomerase n=1 Tax=Paenibacillus sp. J31TS4 TaxID=2807195 RepID=UPI001B28C394|nr:type 2 isopentenyl-diphosphate Delta-isomerase [Paenibacillus sp. J31TS4]GIP41176.1 isopentenyl-diphosphate delta-isomerase [Paenibacillus sp. J31TS4]
MDEQRETRIERRKSEHIDICLTREVSGEAITTGLERYRFRHNALPELDLAAVRTDTAFLGKAVRTPFVVSSMTGGPRHAGEINRRLAEAAEAHGWSMGVGSVRAALEHPQAAASFRIRDAAPTIPLFANLGAVQLNYGYGPDECRRAVELVEADGLVLHLNSLQEVFQPEGDTNFSGLLRRIEQVCRSLEVPVGAKEVGWGLDGETAARLRDAGISFLDVAGAGGTSWSQVEKYRTADPVLSGAAEAFAGWGIPTAESLVDVRSRVPDAAVIASGGMQTGVDAAKAIALGADLVGFGRSVLASAVHSAEELDALFRRIGLELRAAMFGIGAGTLEELKRTDRLERADVR